MGRFGPLPAGGSVGAVGGGAYAGGAVVANGAGFGPLLAPGGGKAPIGLDGATCGGNRTGGNAAPLAAADPPDVVTVVAGATIVGAVGTAGAGASATFGGVHGTTGGGSDLPGAVGRGSAVSADDRVVDGSLIGGIAAAGGDAAVVLTAGASGARSI